MIAVKAEDLLGEVAKLAPNERGRFARLLLQEYGEELEEVGWLLIAESAFDLWDNQEDAAYDHYPTR